jgi:hypothetical protein
MLHYKLRTLLIVLALGPPTLAGLYWTLDEWRRVRAAHEARLTAHEAQDRLARLEEELRGERGIVIGISSAELDRRFAEIVVGVESAERGHHQP